MASHKASTPQSTASKLHLKQLDGLRGPLCLGVIAINMGLYNGRWLIAGAFTAAQTLPNRTI